MFDLNQRQRVLLLKGLELLRQQPQPKGRGARANGALAEAAITELAELLHTGQRSRSAVHQHPAEGSPQRSYKIAGECAAHGSICIACKVTYHLADGPLEWCRECDLLLAGVEDLAPSNVPAGRRKGQSRAVGSRKAKRQL